ERLLREVQVGGGLGEGHKVSGGCGGGHGGFPFGVYESPGAGGGIGARVLLMDGQAVAVRPVGSKPPRGPRGMESRWPFLYLFACLSARDRERVMPCSAASAMRWSRISFLVALRLIISGPLVRVSVLVVSPGTRKFRGPSRSATARHS